MSIFGQPPGQGSNNAPANSASSSPTYGRGNFDRADLQAAFNWLVNQPEHIRKQASDPDRLMTLYYRSSGLNRTESARSETTRMESMKSESIRSESARSESARVESTRIETEAPVSSQNFISDLRQINEAMRQFDGPGAHASYHPHMPTGSAQVAHSSTQTHAPTSYASTQPTSMQPLHSPLHSTLQQTAVQPAPAHPMGATLGSLKTQMVLAEVREKLNLSSDAEALNILVSLGYRALKPLLG